MRKLNNSDGGHILWVNKEDFFPVMGMRAFLLKFQNEDFVSCYNEAVDVVRPCMEEWNEEYHLIHGDYMGQYEAFLVDRFNSRLCMLDAKFESRDMKIRAFLIGEGMCVIGGLVDNKYVCYYYS